MSSSTSTSSTALSYIVPPLFIGGITALKMVYAEGYDISSPLTISEVMINIGAYEISKLFTEMFLDKMMTSGVMISGTNHVIEPLLAGSIVGLVPVTLLGADDRRILQRLAYVGGRGVARPSSETFFTKFLDGVVINILGTWLSQPLTG